MFLNISNHPSSKWGANQLSAARQLADGSDIMDVQFPNVPPTASPKDVHKLAVSVCGQIGLDPITGTWDTDQLILGAMVQGDFTLTYALVKMLVSNGVPCYSATTERNVSLTTERDGSITKTAQFNFVQFRQYNK